MKYDSKYEKRIRTISNAKCGSRLRQVILELVMEKAKEGDQKVEKYPYAKEKLAAALIDHPQVKLLFECVRFARERGR